MSIALPSSLVFILVLPITEVEISRPTCRSQAAIAKRCVSLYEERTLIL